ncbi:hypothetical protein L6R52_29770 [Myxococcota bacterium]|nr:hypothetical protein [Myxococcota bacterium]
MATRGGDHRGDGAPPSGDATDTPDATVRFVDGLVEAFARYDDPDRVAARAAADAAKDARDAEILERAYLETGQRGSLPLDVAVARMFEHFARALERGTNARQPLPELDPGGYVVLRSDEGALILEVEPPSGDVKHADVLVRGALPELVTFLRSRESVPAVIGAIERLTAATRAPIATTDTADPTPAADASAATTTPATETVIGGPRARVRNSHEMRFFVSFERCRHCNAQLDPEGFDFGADVGTGAALWGKCDHCRAPVGFTFLGDHLSKAPSGRWDELAPGRTEVLAPSKLARELERIAAELVDDPTRLDPTAWELNREKNKRALLCAHELFKLLDDGAAELSDALLDAHEREQRAAHPAWYQRTWIEDRLARHRALVTANVADLPRINQRNAEKTPGARARPRTRGRGRGGRRR